VPAVATHASEIQYVLDLPNAPVPGTLDAQQEQLAAAMRAAWASFAASGHPFGWPSFGGAERAPVMSLVPPLPQVETDYASTHHCAFWTSVAGERRAR
jgi:para-nitrobenzyl esterase